MNVHTNNVTNLKNQFAKIYKTDEAAAIDILKQMRIIHGCAIYDDKMDKENIVKNPINDITDDDWIRLSTNASLIYCIHNHIRRCESLAYNNKKGYATPSILSSDYDIQTASLSQKKGASACPSAQSKTKKQSNWVTGTTNVMNNNNIAGRITKNSTGTDELSLDNIITTEIKQTGGADDIFSESEEYDSTNKSSYNRDNTEDMDDYIENISTTEANDIYSDYIRKQSQEGGNCSMKMNSEKKDETKPTIIFYWADWCSFSNQFVPQWKKFKEQAKKNFPNLQVEELNVGKNKDLNKLANNAGAEAYPTLILFLSKKIDGKDEYYKEKYPKISSKMSADDVTKFVKEKMELFEKNGEKYNKII